MSYRPDSLVAPRFLGARTGTVVDINDGQTILTRLREKNIGGKIFRPIRITAENGVSEIVSEVHHECSNLVSKGSKFYRELIHVKNLIKITCGGEANNNFFLTLHEASGAVHEIAISF